MQGQRRSYVSQGGSNRNSLANSQPPDNERFNPLAHHNPIYDRHPAQSNQRNLSSSHGQFADHYNRNPTQQFPLTGPLKDGFAPDSVRSSLAHSDVVRNPPYEPHDQYNQPSNRGHAGRNKPSHVRNPPGPHDWSSRDPNFDSYSDIHDDSREKRLQQWDRNLPAMEPDSRKHGSFDNLLDGIGHDYQRPVETFNVRSKSHENFSSRYTPELRNENGNGNYPPQQTSYNPSGTQTPNARHSLQSGPNAYRSPPDHLDLSHSYQPDRSGDFRDSFRQTADNSRGDISFRGQQDTSFRTQQDTLFRGQQDMSFRGQQDADQRYSYGRDRNSQSSYAQHSPQNQNDRASQSHHSPSVHSTREQDLYRQAQPQQMNSPNNSLRQDMRLDLSNNLDSSYPNPHEYVNFPSRKSDLFHQSQQPHIHNSSQDFATHNLSHGPHNISHGSSSDPPPERPPYPAAVREQMVKEMALAQTPTTQKDFLTSNELNRQRMQQPPYFQYPSPRVCKTLSLVSICFVLY